MKRRKGYCGFRIKEFFDRDRFPKINFFGGKLQLFNYDQELEEEMVEEDTPKINLYKVCVTFPEEYIEVINLIENGYFVIMDCQYMDKLSRKQFERNLSVELMRFGTHFENLNDNTLLCSADFSIVSMNESEKKGKVYQFKNRRTYDTGEKRG